MAVGSTSESGMAGYNGRMTPFVVLSCMVAASGGVLFGYDLGISGGVSSMQPFLKKFFPDVYIKMKEDSHVGNYCKFDSQLLTAFTSSLYIAGLFASLFASRVTRAFGRRPTMLAGGAAFLAGAAVGGAALNVYMLILARVLLGFGIGFTNQSVPLYLSEMAPPQHRGLLNNGFEFSVGIGILLANLINYGAQKIQAGWGWRLSLSLAGVPALVLTVGAFFLPETPSNVLQRGGDLQEAAALLQKIRGTVDVQRELDDLISASAVSRATHHQFDKILQRRYRPQLVMAVALPFFQQVTGITVINFYSPLVFRTIGLEESASLMSSVVTRLVATAFNLIAMVAADKLGRRTLFIIGGTQILLSQLLLGGIFATQLGDHGGMSKGYAYLVLVVVCIYIAGFAWSWGPLAWLVPSEIFPLEIRSAGMSITVAVGFLFIFLLAQTILTMLCHLKFGIFFFFAVCVFVMTLFVYMLLPETKNRPMEQMDQVWREHWFWRRIVGDGEEERRMTQQGDGEEERKMTQQWCGTPQLNCNSL